MEWHRRRLLTPLQNAASKVIKKFAYINLCLEVEGPEVDEVSDDEGDSDGNDDS